jgi:hypothetical protein
MQSLDRRRMEVMSKIRMSFVLRNLVVAFLLSGMAVGLSACPEKTVSYSRTDNGAGDHDANGSGSGMGGSY